MLKFVGLMMDEVNKNSDNMDNINVNVCEEGIPKVNMKFDGHSWTNQSNAQNMNEITAASGQSYESNNDDQHKAIRESEENSLQQSSPTSTDEGDAEFELTADAMVHDYDDEATLDEEEADDDDDDGDSEELDDLAKEGEMPINDLLALYYSKKNDEDTDYKSHVEENQGNLTTEDEEKSFKAEENDSDENEERTRQLRSTTSFLSPTRPDSGDEDADGDYVPPAPEDWKKAPRVGEDYQVNIIPDENQQGPDYDTTSDQLVWDPFDIAPARVEDYLIRVSELLSNDPKSQLLPSGSHVRDNEDALYLLTQCNNDVEEAIRRFKWRPPPLTSDLFVWSEEECRQFEHGLSLYGKEFHAIHHNKVKTKSIGEIVKFYYIWKKTPRYDNFNAKTRLGKKKDTLHPGVTDYMERLLDETEHCQTSSQHASHSNSTSYPPPHSHSEALQQHLVDLRVMKRQHRQHQLSNNFEGESPTDEYSEINGFAEGEYTDDLDMFDNIEPTLPANHIYPPVPFASIDPAINVGYSDPGHLAPVATTSHHQEVVSVGPVTANRNNNSHVTISADDSLTSKQSFRPLEPANITPNIATSATVVTRTTPLPPDLLSSIDELETAYCSSNTNTSLSHALVQSFPVDSTSTASSVSASEVREVASVELKRLPSSNDALVSDAKRRKIADDKTHVSHSTTKESSYTHKTFSSSSFPSSSQSDLSHDSRSDSSRIATC